MIRLIEGDCLEIMEEMEPGSIDLVICDLPYGSTNQPYDQKLDLARLWACYRRIGKPTTAYCMFGAFPFTVELGASNLAWLKYDLVWRKGRGTQPHLAKHRPMSSHENILIFYDKPPTYNPQFLPGEPYKPKGGGLHSSGNLGSQKNREGWTQEANPGFRWPISDLYFPQSGGHKLHAHAKPVALLEWLVKTYSNPGETVLDNCMGSGMTGRACMRAQRSFIGIELDPHNYSIADRAVNNQQMGLFVAEEPELEQGWEEEADEFDQSG